MAVALLFGSHFIMDFIRSIASGEAPCIIFSNSDPGQVGNLVPIILACLILSFQVVELLQGSKT